MRSERAEADAPTTAAAPASTDADADATRQPAGNQTTTLSEMTPQLDFEMRVAANVRYHEDRQAFFEAASRWTNFLVVLAGSGAASSSYAEAHGLTVAAGLAAAIVGGAQLVFDFGGKARTHLELKRIYAKLLAGIIQSDADLERLQAKQARLYGEEPEPYHAVNALAYNATQLGYGRLENTLLVVSPWQRWTRHVWRYEPSLFRTAEEIAASPPKVSRWRRWAKLLSTQAG